MHHPSQLVTSCCLIFLACSGDPEDAGSGNDEVPRAGRAGVAGSGVEAGRSSAAGGTTSAGAGGVDAAGTGAALAGASAALAGTGGQAGGGGSAPGGSAGAAGRPASGAIDFAAWVLQLPVGSGTSPTTISSAQLLRGYQDDYFYLAEDGGQIFMDPATGITTSGSQHCRTELREQTPGEGNAAWASTGTNTMTVEGKVLKVGSGSVAVAQLFNSTDSIPLIELQYTTGHKFSLFYEESKGGGEPSVDLKSPVALDTRYAFTLALSAGKLSVSINGKEVYTRTPSASILDNKFYFKVGNYDQSSKAGTPSKTPYSIVEVYKVNLVHQ